MHNPYYIHTNYRMLHTILTTYIQPRRLFLSATRHSPPSRRHMLRPGLRRANGAARFLVCPQCRLPYALQPRIRPHSPPQFASSPPVRSLRTASHESPDYIPLRQQLKQEAKTVKSRKRQRREDEEASRQKWELTVGIEIHAQLNTESKLFSRP